MTLQLIQKVIMGKKMQEELYLYHLLSSMQWQKQNALNQKGKSDIEPPDYDSRVETWFNQIIDRILKEPPEYYVEALETYDNEFDDIVDIQYVYFSRQETVKRNTAISISRIKTLNV